MRSLGSMDTLQVVQQMQAARYITCCSLAFSMWDWTLALAEEYQTLKRCGRSCALLVYFLARISTGTLCVLFLIFNTGAIRPYSCSAVFTSIGSMAAIANAAKSCLFFFRVRAVYSNSKLVTIFAGAGWLVVVFARAAVVCLVYAAPVGQTGSCAIYGFSSIATLPLWLNCAYDTCIFVAISVRLTINSTSTTEPRILSAICGYRLPHTMRHLLQDGLTYYFTTIFFSLLAAIITIPAQVGPIYQVVFTIPAAAIETIMACKVFRAMILRSVAVEHGVFLAPVDSTCINATSVFELTVLEHQTQTADTEQDQVC